MRYSPFQENLFSHLQPRSRRKNTGQIDQNFIPFRIFLYPEYDDFNELYTAIRSKQITGLLNADIAAYQQLDWNEGIPAEQHLAVIQVVPMSVSVSAGLYLEWENEYWDCTMKHWEKAQRNSIEKFRRKPDVGLFVDVSSNKKFSYRTCRSENLESIKARLHE